MSDWAKDGACRDKPQSWWFPEGGTSPDRAKAVCLEACPVREECLEFALNTNQTHGVWGGLEFKERKTQRAFRVLYCAFCGRRFTWKPVGGAPPSFCSSGHRRASYSKSRSDSRRRRRQERELGATG